MTNNKLAALVESANRGERTARDELFALVYDELCQRAHRQLADLPRGTLCTTQLVHDTYLKLVDRPLSLNDRAHFFRLVARAMRQVLIDQLRSRGAERRGGDAQRLTLGGANGGTQTLSLDVLALDQALQLLRDSQPDLADVVELRLLAGLDFENIAELRGQSERTVYRDWRAARAFLRHQLEAGA